MQMIWAIRRHQTGKLFLALAAPLALSRRSPIRIHASCLTDLWDFVTVQLGTTRAYRVGGGSNHGSKAVERNGTVLYDTFVKAPEYSAFWD